MRSKYQKKMNFCFLSIQWPFQLLLAARNSNGVVTKMDLAECLHETALGEKKQVKYKYNLKQSRAGSNVPGATIANKKM